MTYFFGNRRNDKGLCATTGCTGEAVHSFVYGYCDKCYAIIMKGLDAGQTPDVGLRVTTATNTDTHRHEGSAPP